MSHSGLTDSLCLAVHRASQRYRANSLLFRTRQSEHRSSKAAADATPAPYVRPDPRRLARKKSMRKAAALLPRAYRKAHIKVGKRGILDFNFGYHNVSKFAGLEDSCPNAAFNAALQVRVPSVRRVVCVHRSSVMLEGADALLRAAAEGLPPTPCL